jgi:hypothetical protein
MSRPLPPRGGSREAPNSTIWALLTEAELDPDQQAEEFFLDDADIEATWSLWKEVIVTEWAKAHPGTRLDSWWQREAPGPRQRVGGVGTPKPEVLAWLPRYWHGLPMDWVSQDETDIYNGRSLDFQGHRLTRADGTPYREGDFRGLPPDPRNPPKYESEATFLDRNGLLLPAERRRLRPADFAPVTVEFAE